jgi:hypothetical protein
VKIRQKDMNNVVIYNEGELELKVSVNKDTIWLSQKQLSELFEVTKQNVSLHINRIFKDEELKEDLVVKYFLTTAKDGKQYKTKQGIFYDGQIFQGNFFTKVKTAFASFNAYSFVSDLIRSAKQNIILIDNYIDDTILTIFSKVPNVKVTIYTHTVSKQLKLDLQKYNEQYNNITLKTFKNSHDRFLILDEKELYHLEASLKDLGKKWFAFSRMDVGSVDVLSRLNDD